MTLLSTFFLFLAIVLFMQVREQLAADRSFFFLAHLGYYLGALVAGLCALTSKENPRPAGALNFGDVPGRI
jgi:hypothetical protein